MGRGNNQSSAVSVARTSGAATRHIGHQGNDRPDDRADEIVRVRSIGTAAAPISGEIMSMWHPFLAAVFFGSGFAALIYQIAWQRSLFTIFGINVQEPTVV